MVPEPKEYGGGGREIGFALAALLLARLAPLWLVHTVFSEAEPTSDAVRWLLLAQSPLSSLTDATMNDSAPLLGLALAMTIRPWTGWLTDPLACRLGLLLWEAVAALFVFATVRALRPRQRLLAWVVLGLWALTPTTWMTSVVAAQDEVVAAALMSAMMFAFVTERSLAGWVLAALAVIAGKVFAIALFASLLVLCGHRERSGAMVGLTTIGLGYGVQWGFSARAGADAPMWSLRPPIDFATGGWTLLVGSDAVELSTARTVSLLLCAFAMLGILTALRRCSATGTSCDPQPILCGWAASMCVMFALFYHVNPEYYLLVIPAIVLSPFALPLRATVTLLCGVPWLVNITYAARWRLAKGVDDPVSRLFNEASSAIAMHQFALGLSTICSLLVAAWSLWWLRELRSQSEPRHLADAS